MATVMERPATSVVLDDVAIEGLRDRVRGAVIVPDDADYDAARTVWNGMVDRYPAVIVRCEGIADVLAAVSFARASALPVAIRGGGHNVAGNAVGDGGVVVDCSRMKGIHVDPAARTARVEPGVLWGELDRETQVFGLATPGGVVSSTGVAGLTLGGGLGWLLRRHGLACDNLLAADIVTADGRLITASPTEHPDLFWGLRGGGGNFGVVTSFLFRLHPVGPVLAGPVIYPLDQAREVLRGYRELMRTAPDDLTASVVILTTPEGARVVGVAVCHSGGHDEGLRVLAPLRKVGQPIADLIRPMPYVEFQTMFDATGLPGQQNYWKTGILPELSDAAIDAIATHAETIPSPNSLIIIEELGGAVRRVPAAESAFAARDGGFSFLIQSTWGDPADMGRNITWTRAVHRDMERFMGGRVYVNYLGAEETDLRAAYGTERHERLTALKTAYDPTNMFRFNQNIAPDPAGA